MVSPAWGASSPSLGDGGDVERSQPTCGGAPVQDVIEGTGEGAVGERIGGLGCAGNPQPLPG